MTPPPIQPSEWWALVNRGGHVCDMQRTRKQVIEAFQAQFPFENQEPWKNIRRSWKLTIRRVIVQAPEVER